MIETIAEPDLVPEDEAQIAEILRDSFPTDFGGRSFYQQRPHMRIVWREERIVSQLSLFLRAIRVGDDLVDAAGIGDVATAPGARGKGHADAVVAKAVEVARSSGVRFLILFGDRTLYDRAGFLPVANRFRYIKMIGARTGEVTEGSSPFFRVKALTEERWQEGEQVDFLGHLF
ncbi:GNAT family N-acetyltransferase [Antarctobacter jejuensis]|uniref:GNAT family N-acetyltransferase n=1 Tax=Antarctobacter jejuensis TaxID=1439938 RepID=UPI003FD109AF